jgi:NAD(P)-dependent dehydrogenase (short-subunit alcohol dehydrogenase family)
MPVLHDFSGQTAIVTGDSKSIGRAIAERLRDTGAKVWVWDIAPAELDGIRSLAIGYERRPDRAGGRADWRSYGIRLISSACSAWATSGSLYRG